MPTITKEQALEAVARLEPVLHVVGIGQAYLTLKAYISEAATALEARLPPDSRYSVADIRKIAADRGPHFDGCARACLVWAADTLAAADVVIRELREQGRGDSR